MTKRQIVLDYFSDGKESTARMMAEQLNIKTAAASSYITNLLDGNLIIESKVDQCPISKTQRKFYKKYIKKEDWRNKVREFPFLQPNEEIKNNKNRGDND